MTMQLSKYTLNDLGKVDNKDFVKEAFRAVIANGTPAINKNTDSCMYRTFDGAACAVGVCLDDAMVKSIETDLGRPITDIVVNATTLLDSSPVFAPVLAKPESTALLTYMQVIHDDAAESCFETGAPMSIEELIYVADTVGANLSVECIANALKELQAEIEPDATTLSGGA